MFRGPSVYIGGDRLAICWAPDPSPPSRVGNQRAYTQVPMAESTAGARARKQRRGPSTTPRASATTIAKFFDVQLPALTAYLTPLASLALAATSKERLQALAKRPVMAALARTVPILSMAAVLKRIAEARLPGAEVLAIVRAQEWGSRRHRSTFDYECVVECTLRNGARIVERGRVFEKCSRESLDGFFLGNMLYVDLPLQDRSVTVLESAKIAEGYDFYDPDVDYENSTAFFKRVCDVGDAKVTIVRSDGRFLPLFHGNISMIPQFYPDAYTSGRSFPYYAETPFDVLKWSQTATHDAFRDPDWSAILASYPDWQLAARVRRHSHEWGGAEWIENLCSNATLVASSSKLPSGAYAYQAQSLQMKFQWYEYPGVTNCTKLKDDHALLRLLDGQGDWR